MRHPLFILTLLATPLGALAQGGPAIGYPTVKAAWEALSTRNDVTISVQGGMTIIVETSGNASWTFTPPNHPAWPAVVKRFIVSSGGNLGIEMTALCQASKVACDKLMEEFKGTSERVQQSMGGETPSAQSVPQSEIEVQPPNVAVANNDAQWRPTSEQVKLVEHQTHAWFAAKDGRKYQDAYGQLSSSQKKTTSFERWRSLAEDFNSKAGEVRQRSIKNITWYKNPAQAEPGIYAAVDFSSQFANADIHCGYVVWHEQTAGSFLLVREEVNFIDKPTAQKLKPDELEKVRAQFGCKA